MSEFSWSFHIRAADAAVEKLLGTAKFSGLVFGPANGWLTFVPYADVGGKEATIEPKEFAAKLLKATGLPVLAYSFVEDEFWSFALVRTGKPPCWFSCAWEPEPIVERDGLDLSAFDGICTGASIEAFLRDPSEEDGGGEALAYGFAEALGLPAFRWLSPDYAQRSADYYILEGGRRVGPHQPVKENPLDLPPPRKFVLPRSDLSAREALALLRPLTEWMDAAWVLNFISGDIDRTEWLFRYVHRNTRETVDVCIHPNGTGDCQSRDKDTEPSTRDEAHAFIEAHRGSWVVEEMERKLQTSAGSKDVELPANWLDSVQAVDIAAHLQPPPDVPEWVTGGLSLIWDWLPEARWCVERFPVDSSSKIEKWTIDIDAVTGRVLTETLYDFQMRDGLYEPRRERIAEGAWRVL